MQSLAFGPGPGNGLLAAGGENGTIQLWRIDGDATDDAQLTAHESAVRNLAFSADGTLLASAGRDGQVLLWDVANRMALEPALTEQAEVGWRLAFGASERG